MIGNISFKGIANPYTNRNGFHIIPIAKNPTETDIRTAINATKTETAHNGLNGRAYFYSEDLVVKKYRNEKEACNYGPQREINALDRMFDEGIISENMQRGEFAFSTPDNEIYLVSTKVNGQNANPINNKFNSQNLHTLVHTIGELDKPRRKKENEINTGRFQSFPQILPYKVAMHYDLALGNFNITEENAGIFDFEYLNFEDLNPTYFMMTNGFFGETLSDLSDIPGIVSNLRTFEYRGFLNYLEGLENKQEARKVFFDYLQAKSNYHKTRADFYRYERQNTENKEEREELTKLHQKELCHSRCLKYPTVEIVKAEAIKIQIASFIYTQSPFSRTGNNKINPEQIKTYVENAYKFFNKEYYRASNPEEKEYFKDCLDLMRSWNNLPNWMNWQECKHSIEEFIYPHKSIEELTPEELETAIAHLNEENQKRELFLSKVTDKETTTLDKMLFE